MLDDLSSVPGIHVTEGETQPLQLSPSFIHVPSQHTLDKAAMMLTLYTLIPGNCSAFRGKWNSGQGLEQLYHVSVAGASAPCSELPEFVLSSAPETEGL